MITDTRERIVEFIGVNGRVRVNDLVEHLGLGNVAIHRQLKRLVESGVLTKIGTPPKVFYLPAEKQEKPERKKPNERKIRNTNFATDTSVLMRFDNYLIGY